jgi:voltage-gated potassium channel
VGGQFLASIVMILGYGIIAVPTGIVTVELGRSSAPAAARSSGREVSFGLQAPRAHR